MTTSHSWLPPSTENFNSEVEVHIATGKMVCPFGVSQVIDWQTNLGPREGKAGEVATISTVPGLFRGQKIIATDTADPPGSGTLIGALFVGRKSQRPMNSRTPTSHFSVSSLTRGIKMDTCEEALTISMEVVYLVDCTFSATIFGKKSQIWGD